MVRVSTVYKLNRKGETKAPEVKQSAIDNYVAPGEMPTKEEEDDDEEEVKEMLVGSPPSRFKPNSLDRILKSAHF